MIKNALITGANNGIGLETAKGLAKLGYHVILACRSKNKAEVAEKEIIAEVKGASTEILLMDLGSLENVRSAAALFLSKHQHLDVLVNNAGLITQEKQLTKDKFEYMLGVNHLGHFLLTGMLLPVLKATPSARIVNVSSEAHRMPQSIPWQDMNADKSFSAMQRYGLSKLYNVLFTNKLAEKLRDTNITVNSLHPGVVNTGFAKNSKGTWNFIFKLLAPLLIDAAKGARTSIFVASNVGIENQTGKYYKNQKEAKVSKLGSSKEEANKLWEFSEQATGISY